VHNLHRVVNFLEENDLQCQSEKVGREKLDTMLNNILFVLFYTHSHGWQKYRFLEKVFSCPGF